MRPMRSPEKPIRIYRDRLTVVMIRSWVTLLVIILLILGIAPAFPLAVHIAALLVAVVAVWIGYRAGRMCVAITLGGIWLGNGFFSRWIPWTDVEGFIAVPWGFYSEIRVQTHGNRKPYRAALTQGRKMNWKEGSTRDVLGALNADMAAARKDKLGDPPTHITAPMSSKKAPV